MVVPAPSAISVPPPSAAPVTPPQAAPTVTPPRAEVTLEPQRFERAWLAFDGLSGVKPELHAWDVGGVFHQDRRLATGDERLEILVRAHGDETLAAFESDHASYNLSTRSPLQICGRSAELVRATREAEHITCVMVEPPGQNHPAYNPPTEIAAVAFEHHHLGVVLTIQVAAAEPTAYRPLVDRIIASIRCL